MKLKVKAVYRGRQLPRNQAIQTLYYSVFLRLTNIASWSYICKLLIAPSAIQPKWVDINVSTLRPQAHRTRSQYCLLIAFISPQRLLGLAHLYTTRGHPSRNSPYSLPVSHSFSPTRYSCHLLRSTQVALKLFLGCSLHQNFPRDVSDGVQRP